MVAARRCACERQTVCSKRCSLPEQSFNPSTAEMAAKLLLPSTYPFEAPVLLVACPSICSFYHLRYTNAATYDVGEPANASLPIPYKIGLVAIPPYLRSSGKWQTLRLRLRLSHHPSHGYVTQSRSRVDPTTEGRDAANVAVAPRKPNLLDRLSGGSCAPTDSGPAAGCRASGSPPTRPPQVVLHPVVDGHTVRAGSNSRGSS